MKIGVTAAFSNQDCDPVRFAIELEQRGFSSLYLPHHTHLPVEEGAPPALVGGVSIEDYRSLPDPIVVLGAIASVTSKIRLGTGVLLVGQLDPIVLAKQLATLDQLSKGRVTLGAGYGWNRKEAEAHGLDFEKRRSITNDKLACMRAIWASDPASYQGTYVDLAPSWSRPKPVQSPSIPVLLGGFPGERLFSTLPKVGDGWIPVGGTGLGKNIPLLREAFERSGRDPDTLQIVPFGVFPEKSKLEYFEGIGVTEVVLRVSSGSHDEMVAQLDAFSY